jgi:hypothetical protein
MTMQAENLAVLLELLHKTEEQEIDCDTFWEKAAWLAETDVNVTLLEGRAYVQHIQICSGCEEDLEVLKGAIVR